MRNWYYTPNESHRGRYEVVQAIIDSAKLYSCQVVNLYEESGINEFNAGISDDGNGNSQERFYFKDNSDAAFIAGAPRVHPNANGGARIAELIASKL